MTAPAPDPSQPTVYEMIRTLGRQMEEQRQATTRLETTCSMLVTQDQRRADSDLNTLRFTELVKDVVATSDRITWWSRAAMAGIGFPVVLLAIGWMAGMSITMPNA